MPNLLATLDAIAAHHNLSAPRATLAALAQFGTPEQLTAAEAVLAGIWDAAAMAETEEEPFSWEPPAAKQ